ncbi:helix-turn-helix domain-containing protein [Kiloniella majae]|uniref:helix-turn-helix domain-containing protein n=1 Tax=Kiloniella majae TaxID=1938558 RepID=UPI000A277C6E|nr:helix-turn-helix transcriptional regulator [Kiloniella majae]
MNNEPRETLGKRIRIAAGMVKGGAELARNAGVSRNTLENYLTDATEPKITVLVKIAEITGLSLAWLATGQGPMMASDLAEHKTTQYRDAVSLNEDVLIAVIEAAEKWIIKNADRHNFSPAEKARVFRALYRAEIKRIGDVDAINTTDIEQSVHKGLTYLSELVH